MSSSYIPLSANKLLQGDFLVIEANPAAKYFLELEISQMIDLPKIDRKEFVVSLGPRFKETTGENAPDLGTFHLRIRHEYWETH